MVKAMIARMTFPPGTFVSLKLAVNFYKIEEVAASIWLKIG
jgi:hypothetical protein